MIEHNPFNPVTQLGRQSVPLDKDAPFTIRTCRPFSYGCSRIGSPSRPNIFFIFLKTIYARLRRIENIPAWLPF